MKLEARVERLEHELKILKNEIQQTLLDIQEQILIHYYPSLRAGEDEAPEQLGALVESIRSERRNGGTAKGGRASLSADADDLDLGDSLQRGGHRNGHNGKNGHNGHGQADRWETKAFITNDLDLDELDDDEDLGDEDLAGYGLDDDHEDEVLDAKSTGTAPRIKPKTREVSLTDIKQTKTKPRSSRLDFGALADWVGESVTKVGKERTRKAVETYASSGYLPDETQAVLVQLLDLAEDVEQPAAAGSNASIEIIVKLDQILGNAHG